MKCSPDHTVCQRTLWMCFWLLETCTKCSYFIEENILPGTERLAFEVKYEYIVRRPRTYCGPVACTCASFQTTGAWCVKYCCDWKARAACAQNFTLWQQATIEFMRHNRSIIACSCRIYMGVVLCTHSVRGEQCIQRNTNREVAITSPPFYNEPHRSHVLFSVCTWHNLDILVTAPLCCESQARAACAQSFAL